MKVKTSVTLEKSVLADIDLLTKDTSRSEFIQDAVTREIRRMKRIARDQRDLEIINKNAKKLNKEAMDALKYQIPI